MFRLKQQLTYACHNKEVNQVLTEIFASTRIRYSVVNGYIVLQSAPETNQAIARHKLYTVSGTIVDSSNNEIMIGTTVYIKETGAGVVTNNYGFYSLTIPEGSYTIQTSYLGYASKTRNLDLKSNVSWNIKLAQVPVTMKEIVINSINREELIFGSLAAQTNVDPHGYSAVGRAG